MPRSLKLAIALAGVVLLGCAQEEAETDEAATDTTAMEETATFSLSDVAGTWNMRAVPQTGDTTPTIYQVEATADSWTLFLPDREPMVAQTSVSGDSIIVDAGPYESVRRAGVQVTTHGVFRLEGDRLIGTTVAHYTTADADSVLRLDVEGTRAP
jgi:glucose/arabinose dehydrogenase